MKTLFSHGPSFGLAAAGLAWPTLYGFATWLALSPYERAIADSFCGVAPHANLMLAHCPACWVGAFTLLAASLGAAYLREHPRFVDALR